MNRELYVEFNGPSFWQNVQMILESLQIKNFRALEDFEVPVLGHVNLIVGKNNSGKSTVLEALRVFARNANPALLKSILTSHDETKYSEIAEESEDGGTVDSAYQHFFPKREFPRSDDQSIYIGSADESRYVRISHMHYVREIAEVRVGGADTTETTTVTRRKPVSKAQLQMLRGGQVIFPALNVTTEKDAPIGWIDLSPEMQSRTTRGPLWDVLKDIPTSYVPTQFLPHKELAVLWDSIALTDGETFVRRALQIVDPAVRGLAFIQGDQDDERTPYARRSSGGRIAIVKLDGSKVPVPLNSMGDGMLRVLQLVLTLFPARNGFMLIDEFENGLHYSVQEDTWRILFELATRFNVQIFATTHSWDCIRAFKTAAIESPKVGVLFRVGRSVRKHAQGKIVATTFSEDELMNLTQSQIEVR